MPFGALISASNICLKLKARTRDAAFQELALYMAPNEGVEFQKHLVEVLSQREEQASTAIGNRVALPHGTSDRSEQVLAAVGISPLGISYDGPDSPTVQIIVALVFPRIEYQRHVRILAAVAQLLSNATFRRALVHVPSIDAAMRLLCASHDESLNAPRSDAEERP